MKYNYKIEPSVNTGMYFLRVCEVSGNFVMSMYDNLVEIKKELDYWTNK